MSEFKGFIVTTSGLRPYDDDLVKGENVMLPGKRHFKIKRGEDYTASIYIRNFLEILPAGTIEAYYFENDNNKGILLPSEIDGNMLRIKFSHELTRNLRSGIIEIKYTGMSPHSNVFNKTCVAKSEDHEVEIIKSLTD